MAGSDWPVAYPFQYYPQGRRPGAVPDYDSCLLSPEPADACFATVPPTYFGTVYFEAVMLDRRNNLEPNDVLFRTNGVPVFNTADFNVPVEAGIRAGVVLSSPCGNDWIGEYFGVHSFQDNALRTDPIGVVPIFFGQLGPVLPAITAEYESTLDSAELYVRTRQSRRIAPLAGIRYLQLEEEFNVMQDPVARQGWYSETDNDLFGFQFGLQGLLFEYGPWRMETMLKAGPFYNSADVHAFVNPAGQATFITRHASSSHTAFLGELRVGLVWRLGRRVNFRLGYDALWLSGIAQGPNQTNNVSFATNLQVVDLSDVLFQGGHIGFDLSW
jgi:hypothetical protein